MLLPGSSLLGLLALALPLQSGGAVDAIATGIAYTPPERNAPDAPEHQLSVFLPPGPPPARGWPVLFWNVSGGFRAAGPVTRIDPDQDLHRIAYGSLQRGLAVVSYGVTGATLREGQFYAPGDPSGNYESLDYDMPEKCAVWAIQWARETGAAQFELDMERAGHLGNSSGANLGLWCALGPDRASATGSSFVRRSTQLAFVVANRGAQWFPAQLHGMSLLGARHFVNERNGSPASRLNQVAPEDLVAISPAAIQLAPGANAATTAVYAAYDEPVGSAQFRTDSAGLPLLADVLGNVHDGWHGYLRQRDLELLAPAFHAANSRLAIATGFEAGAGTLRGLEDFTWKGHTFDQELADDCIAWIAERVAEVEPPSPAPVASFTATPTSGTAPLEVLFTDRSNGDVTSRLWTFGDGATSAAAAPTHVYVAPGTYTVSLSVTGPGGSDVAPRPGLVQVGGGPAAGGDVTLFGCGVNPAGSLVLVSGEPALGATLLFGIDNPLGTQPPGASSTLVVSTSPDPAYPCGSLRTGFGMSAPGAAGELLVQLGPALVGTLPGPRWMRPGMPASIPLSLGTDPALIGTKLYVQGMLIDAGGGRGLTVGAEITIGP